MSLNRVVSYCRDFIDSLVSSFDRLGPAAANAAGFNTGNFILIDSRGNQSLAVSNPDDIYYIHFRDEDYIRVLAWHYGKLVQMARYPVEGPVICPLTGQPQLDHQIWYLPARFKYLKEVLWTLRYHKIRHGAPPPEICDAIENLHVRPPELPSLRSTTTYISLPPSIAIGNCADMWETAWVQPPQLGQDLLNMMEVCRGEVDRAMGISSGVATERLHHAAMESQLIAQAALSSGLVNVSERAINMHAEFQEQLTEVKQDLNKSTEEEALTEDTDDDLLERIENLLEDDSLDEGLDTDRIPRAAKRG